MKKSDRLKIVILGITGLLILIGTGIFIFIRQAESLGISLGRKA